MINESIVIQQPIQEVFITLNNHLKLSGFGNIKVITTENGNMIFFDKGKPYMQTGGKR